MSANDCPPLYIPTRSECNAMKDQSRSELLAAGINPARWNLDAMGCSCGSHIEDVDPETAAEPLPTVVEPLTSAVLDAEYHNWQDAFPAEARAFGFNPGKPCEKWSQGLDLNCERPPLHSGDHAAVLGMDPDVNDWVRWS